MTISLFKKVTNIVIYSHLTYIFRHIGMYLQGRSDRRSWGRGLVKTPVGKSRPFSYLRFEDVFRHFRDTPP